MPEREAQTDELKLLHCPNSLIPGQCHMISCELNGFHKKCVQECQRSH